MSTVGKQKNDFEVIPVAGHIGAEIRGIRLSADLDDAQIQAIYRTVLKHKVVFFRGQNHLDDASQEAFASRFGDLYAHPTVPVRTGTKSIFELDSQNGGSRVNSWHTDITFVDAYPKISVLRAVVVPDAGGDTVWANTAYAYQTLPRDLRDLADKLWALHTNDFDYGAHRYDITQKDLKHFEEVFTRRVFETEHPIVRVHPETGERTLILGHFVDHILGLSSSDSAHLLSILQNHITRLEHTVRWRWSAGDVAIWDNRATQHYAINDYGDKQRIVRRVTIAGEVPVSIDGKTSFTRLRGATTQVNRVTSA